MIVTLDEMKQYLRVNFEDDDALLEGIIDTAEKLCADTARMTVSRLSGKSAAKTAVMYAVAYLYEHREEADHHALALSLRSLLAGIRRTKF